MAESILFNLASKTITILASSALEEFRLAWNVKQDIRKMGNTLSMIKAVISDAEEQEALDNNNNPNGVKEWVARLKDVVYDVDDLLDDFATESLLRKSRSGEKKARRKKVRNFFSKSNPFVSSLKMGDRIKGLRERLDAISADRRNFQFNERLPNITSIPNNKYNRETYSFVRQEEVMGRDGEKKAIIDFLLGNCSSSNNSDHDVNKRRNVSVVSVVGVGGLGKTALAQLVYNDELVQKHFEPKIWVCVSDDHLDDVKKIGDKILGDGAATHNNNRGPEQVQQDVREKMRGKRYLLVLDDIWDENREHWLKLMGLLLDGAEGSMAIVTTRSKKVAKITSSDFTHLLQGLDDEQSWALFSQLAFEKKGGEEILNHHHPKQLVDIGKEIVKKCVGVPLAIRAIASHLYTQNSERYWSYFRDNELSRINMEEDDIFPILKLSYNHLPSHLKRCFAYCSLFPKDYRIERETLIQLWMAQGFIIQSAESKKNRCLEDVGDEYFTYLLWRSFFQDVTRNKDGVIVSFKLHDLMHDLLTKITGNECTTIGDITTSSVININASTRHLSLDLPYHLDSRWKVTDALLKTNKLRTFHILNRSVYIHLQPKSLCALLSRGLMCSRVLDLKGLLSKEGLPSSIGMLKHLRYLNLSDNKSIEVLPPCIAMLLNLQTLDLTRCSKLKKLPRELRRMTNLRHLKLEGCIRLRYMPYKLGELTSLQTLCMFVLDAESGGGLLHGGGGASSKFKSGIRELGGLNNLRGHLHIKGLEHMRRGSSDDDDTTEEDIKAAKLHEKQSLGSIEFSWSDLSPENEENMDKDEIVLQGLQPHPNVKVLQINLFGGERLSGWDSFCTLSNLVNIEFFDCSRLQELPPLHQFPHLKKLTLNSLSALEYIEDNSVVNDDDGTST